MRVLIELQSANAPMVSFARKLIVLSMIKKKKKNELFLSEGFVTQRYGPPSASDRNLIPIEN